MDEEKKKALGLRVSTKLEEAWYVKPELLAGEDPPPESADEDDDGLPEPDKTMNLDQEDLHEAPGELEETSEDARHYLGVSLKGAVLAKDAAEESSEAVAGPLAPPPPPGTSLPSRIMVVVKAFAAGVVEFFSAVADGVAPVFEPGRVPPIILAGVSFLVGVALTLLGVVIAL